MDHRRGYEVRHHPGDPSQWVARTESDRAFEVAIGAILTQNAAWKNVETALVCLAYKNLLTSKRLSTARLPAIQTCIRSSGYFRQKAKKLKFFARFVEEELGGDLNIVMSSSSEAKDLPIRISIAREMLLSLWGIGPETADTILLYGLGVPSFVVDTYTRRLLVEVTRSRLWLKMPYDDVQAFCSDAIPRSVRAWQEAHAVIVAWGKESKSKH
jgi:endonuclease-3 related protein